MHRHNNNIQAVWCGTTLQTCTVIPSQTTNSFPHLTNFQRKRVHFMFAEHFMPLLRQRLLRSSLAFPTQSSARTRTTSAFRPLLAPTPHLATNPTENKKMSRVLGTIVGAASSIGQFFCISVARPSGPFGPAVRTQCTFEAVDGLSVRILLTHCV